MLYKIAYPFQNFGDAVVDVWECMLNFVLPFCRTYDHQSMLGLHLNRIPEENVSSFSINKLMPIDAYMRQ